MDFNKRHGEDGETNSTKRLKGVAIQIPGGKTYRPEELEYLVSDAELGKMCETLGKNWQLVGLSVGLESVDIEQCEESNPRSIQLQVYEMLRRWKKENPERATMYALIQAIKKNNASVSWNKVNKLLNERLPN
ncbi:hypothetical protein ACJMK2_012169 [Sinanodonta woodiana]|uniref:Death domain-containing protein n=1 Tax=Sinanodonta woodiana TaxID=1069815 RepID=A0ABD3V7C0_SINWO